MHKLKIWLITIALMTICTKAQNFSTELIVKDSTHQVHVTIGMTSLASDSFDVGLDLLAPPPPPSGAFDARLIFNNLDYLKDYRESTTDTTIYRLEYSAAQGEGPIVLSWDKLQLAQWGSFVIVDDSSGNLFGPLDMLTVDSLVASDQSIRNGLRIIVVADFQVGVEEPGNLPLQIELAQNYPNPFNPGTTIQYSLPYQAVVTLEIYNTAGQLVKVLINSPQTAGNKIVYWDGTNQFGAPVASGIYLYRIKVGSFVKSKKMILLK
jgi:hypothetical protein